METENKYLYVHYNMPQVSDWNPTAAANLFMTEKSRREHSSSSTSMESKSRALPYFNGIFPEAQKLFDPDDNQQTEANDDHVSSNKFFDF